MMAVTYETLDCNTYGILNKPRNYQQVFIEITVGKHVYIISSPIDFNKSGFTEIEVEIKLASLEKR
ncbi:hypothetical protein AFK68_22665 [Hydrocoleum sp. CS-953]|nr:hypothetical protein AFK68_22665 [Hydrocoleum sp. CS-953]